MYICIYTDGSFSFLGTPYNTTETAPRLQGTPGFQGPMGTQAPRGPPSACLPRHCPHRG